MDRLTDGLDDCMDQSVERQIDIYGDLDGKKKLGSHYIIFIAQTRN